MINNIVIDQSLLTSVKNFYTLTQASLVGQGFET